MIKNLQTVLKEGQAPLRGGPVQLHRPRPWGPAPGQPVDDGTIATS